MLRNLMLFFNDEKDVPVIYSSRVTTVLLLAANLLALTPQLLYIAFSYQQFQLKSFLIAYFVTLGGVALTLAIARFLNKSESVQEENNLPVSLFGTFKLTRSEYVLLAGLMAVHLGLLVFNATGSPTGQLDEHFAGQMLGVRDLSIVGHAALIMVNGNLEEQDYFGKVMSREEEYNKWFTSTRKVETRLFVWGLLLGNLYFWADYFLWLGLAHFVLQYLVSGNESHLIVIFLLGLLEAGYVLYRLIK